MIEPDRFCAACWQALPLISPPVCQRYGVPLPFDLGPEPLSPLAVSDPPVFERGQRFAMRVSPASLSIISNMGTGPNWPGPWGA